MTFLEYVLRKVMGKPKFGLYRCPWCKQHQIQCRPPAKSTGKVRFDCLNEECKDEKGEQRWGDVFDVIQQRFNVKKCLAKKRADRMYVQYIDAGHRPNREPIPSGEGEGHQNAMEIWLAQTEFFIRVYEALHGTDPSEPDSPRETIRKLCLTREDM